MSRWGEERAEETRIPEGKIRHADIGRDRSGVGPVESCFDGSLPAVGSQRCGPPSHFAALRRLTETPVSGVGSPVAIEGKRAPSIHHASVNSVATPGIVVRNLPLSISGRPQKTQDASTPSARETSCLSGISYSSQIFHSALSIHKTHPQIFGYFAHAAPGCTACSVCVANGPMNWLLALGIGPQGDSRREGEKTLCDRGHCRDTKSRAAWKARGGCRGACAVGGERVHAFGGNETIDST